MARPRIVRTKDGGEVTLKNLSPEVADKIKALIESARDEDEEQEEEVATPVAETKEVLMETKTAAPVEAPKPNLSKVALGSFYDKDGKWKVAIVKFDPVTSVASVEKIITAGHEKAYSIERFKILAAEYDLV